MDKDEIYEDPWGHDPDVVRIIAREDAALEGGVK